MRAVVFALLLVFTAPVMAIDSGPAFEDAAMQSRYDELIRELRCVQCRGQSIADSNVGLAADLRRQVRELMAAGKTDAEILTYMTNRYGEYILYNPPVNPTTWLLWAAPIVLLLMGGTTAAVVIARKSKLPVDDSTEDQDGQQKRDRPGAP
jgi:cytochrome c-type biogenesis protein CcmH